MLGEEKAEDRRQEPVGRIRYGGRRVLFFASAEPAFPRRGFTVEMHDRNDEHSITSNLINDALGELVRSAAAGPRGEQRPGFGIL